MKEKFHDVLTRKLEKGSEKENVTSAFLEMDDAITQQYIQNNASRTDGSTAVAAIFVGDTLIVANVGDSEGVLVKKNQKERSVVLVTTIHSPSVESERAHIVQSGGRVWFGRINGNLAVSRAFGDIIYKKPCSNENIVRAEPDVICMEMDESFDFVILACDGLWDVCKYDEAAKLVDTWMYTEGKTPDESSKLLVDYALSKGTGDNVTVIIVKIRWDDDTTLATQKSAGVSLGEDVVMSNPQKRPNDIANHEQCLKIDDDATDTSKNDVVLEDGIESPMYLKTLQGVENINASYMYMNAESHYFCVSKLEKQFPLPCWVCVCNGFVV